ncbi:alpha/beta hydrolase [Bradyrhizobium sp. DOA9]|uniref:alpha/beta hydrolase n=1 Tax=Bradyrhizobium sp. DOA9 TaxID=1126627 RepID=UPI000468DB16|nr:alpha/beta fold hydrolase [Bradyrhizobium sp. DOA9]
MQFDEDQFKQIEALCRAMPLTRMADYGMPRDLAERAHRLVREGARWDEVLEKLGREQEARAEQDPARGRELWHAAAVCFVFAQMAFNADSERKRCLYRQMTHCFGRFAALSYFPVSRVSVPYRDGTLYGWHFHSGAGAASGTVIVFGGMSGWSTAYRSMAESLCRCGLDCLLVDGPGQGDSRLEGGVFADAHIAAGFSRFVEYVQNCTPEQPVGVWGNSFGGLFAALTSVRDQRITACCINGAPIRAEIPPFRTAQEQLAALFGVADAAELAPLLPALVFDGERAPLACATLVLEGGADPLVPVGTQQSFLTGNHHPLSRLETWPDGEHTIYNHAAERNVLAARWFAAALSS